jgi:hypothetical protein
MPVTKDTSGDGGDVVILKSTTISGTTPIVSNPIDVRDKDAVALQLVAVGGGSPAGAWKVEASLDFVPGVTSGAVGGASSGAYGAPAFTGTWSDVTALFSRPTTIATVSAAGSQYVQADPHLDARHIRVTFTPSGGAGSVFANCYRKNWSR